jgi:hypothetical protein
LQPNRSPSNKSLSPQKQMRPELSSDSPLVLAVTLPGQRPMILCAAQLENNAREFSNTRRAGRQKRFAAAFLHTTKVC